MRNLHMYNFIDVYFCLLHCLCAYSVSAARRDLFEISICIKRECNKYFTFKNWAAPQCDSFFEDWIRSFGEVYSWPPILVCHRTNNLISFTILFHRLIFFSIVQYFSKRFNKRKFCGGSYFSPQ